MEKLLACKTTRMKKSDTDIIHIAEGFDGRQTLLDDLPNELLYKILLNLNSWGSDGIENLGIAKRVCKRWYGIVNELIGTYACVYYPHDTRPRGSEKHWKPLPVIAYQPISGISFRLCYMGKKFHYSFQSPHLVRYVEMEDCFPFQYFERYLTPLFNLTELCIHSQILLWTTDMNLEFLEKLPLKVFRLVTGDFWDSWINRRYGLRHSGQNLNQFVDNLMLFLSVKWYRLTSVGLCVVILREREFDIHSSIFKFLVAHKSTLKSVQVTYADSWWINPNINELEQEVHFRQLKISTRTVYQKYIHTLRSWTQSLGRFELHSKCDSSPCFINSLWYEWFLGQRNLTHVTWKPQVRQLLRFQPFPFHLIKANELTLTSITAKIDTTFHHRIDLSNFSGCKVLRELVIIGMQMLLIPVGVRTDVVNGHLLPKSIQKVFLRDLGLPFYVKLKDWAKELPNVKQFSGAHLFQPRGLVLYFTSTMQFAYRPRFQVKFKTWLRCMIYKHSLTRFVPVILDSSLE